jgi:NAD(P)-dependent dehydrogenase (short-subunit alcohol dehydrogenase family)
VVFATARRLESMSQLVARAAVRPLQLDVTDEASVRAAVGAVARETGGRIDVLVNNAGVGLVSRVAGWVVTRLYAPGRHCSGHGSKVAAVGWTPPSSCAAAKVC